MLATPEQADWMSCDWGLGLEKKYEILTRMSVEGRGNGSLS